MDQKDKIQILAAGPKLKGSVQQTIWLKTNLINLSKWFNSTKFDPEKPQGWVPQKPQATN